MRKTIGIGLIVILVLLASYFITGIITERTLKRDIELINQNSGFEVNLKEYRRGWFCSKANFDWIFVVPARTVTDNNNQTRILPAQTYTVAMPLTIHHGPIIFTEGFPRFGFGFAKTTLNLPQEYLSQFNELFKSTSVKPTVNLNILVSFLNRTRFLVEVPDFKLISNEDGSQFEWRGMNNVITLSGSLNNIKGDLDIAGFLITKDNRTLNFDNVNSKYNLRKDVTGLYFGDASINLDSLIAKEDEAQRLRLDHLEILSNSDIKNELFNGSILASFSLLEIQNKRYGPFRLNFALKNLDANALSEINTKVSNLDNPNQSSQQLLWVILPELPRLFNKGARLEIKNTILQVPEGNIKLDLDLGLNKGDLDNPLTVMKKLQGEGTLTLTKQVLYNMMLVSQRHQLIQKELKRQNQELIQQKQNETQVKAMSTEADAGKVKAAEEQVPASEQLKVETNNTTTSTVAPGVTAGSENQVKTVEDRNAALMPDADNLPRIPLGPGPQLTQKINSVLIEKQASVEVNRRIKELLESGMLTEDNDSYIVKFKYSDGELMVNEKPFNPSMLNF